MVTIIGLILLIFTSLYAVSSFHISSETKDDSSKRNTYNSNNERILNSSSLNIDENGPFIAKLKMSPTPRLLAVNPNTNAIYVTQRGGVLSIINGSSNNIT